MPLDPCQPCNALYVMTARSGHRETLARILRERQEAAYDRPCTLHYCAGQSREHPDVFLLYHNWSSLAAFTEWRADPDTAVLRQWIESNAGTVTTDILKPLGGLQNPGDGATPPQIMVSAPMVAHREHVDELPEFFVGVRETIRNWPGNRRIENSRNVMDDSYFHGYGEWDSIEHLNDYMNSPDIRDFFEPLEGKLASSALDVLDVIGYMTR